MDKSKYWRGLTSEEKQAFADKLGITKTYLSNVFSGGSRVSILLAIKISKASNNNVTKKSLRPDVKWGEL